MNRIFGGTLIALALAGMTFAQGNDRRENQQDRIANGVADGQLTAGETARIENNEKSLNHEIAADKAVNGGTLTGAEKAQVNAQQNRLSGQIYNDKHNAVTAHYGNNEIGARRANQQARIAQGIKSGQLNAGETARLEHQESNINHEVHYDRATNGGKPTPGEHAQVNRQSTARAGASITKSTTEYAPEPLFTPVPVSELARALSYLAYRP